MKHSQAFLDLVDAAKPHVREISAGEVYARQRGGEPLMLLDCREDNEWQAGRIAGALHLSRGILERDIERYAPDRSTFLVIYCAGGYRSVLAAESLQRMGYHNVHSMARGIRAWREDGHPEEGQATQ